MTMHERSRRSAESRARRATERAEQLRYLLDQGEGLKRAAFAVGVAVRTARGYRSMTAA